MSHKLHSDSHAELDLGQMSVALWSHTYMLRHYRAFRVRVLNLIGMGNPVTPKYNYGNMGLWGHMTTGI